jgi:hypothetical protein
MGMQTSRIRHLFQKPPPPPLLQESPLNDLEVKNLVCGGFMKYHTGPILFKKNNKFHHYDELILASLFTKLI